MTERSTSAPVYTSTVVAWLPAAAATLISLGIATAVLAATGSPLLVPLLIVAVLITPVGAHLAGVRLIISHDSAGFGHGLRGQLRWIQLAEVAEWHAMRLNWAQVYGIGIPLSRRLNRLTVRAGSALRLTMVDGECVCITTSDPVSAGRLIDHYRKPIGEIRNRRNAS